MTSDKKQLSSFITIPATIEGLEDAVTQILDPATRDVIIEGLRSRKKWRQIKQEYQVLKGKIGGNKAIRQLSEKYHYSEKSIEAIIYNR